METVICNIHVIIARIYEEIARMKIKEREYMNGTSTEPFGTWAESEK